MCGKLVTFISKLALNSGPARETDMESTAVISIFKQSHSVQ